MKEKNKNHIASHHIKHLFASQHHIDGGLACIFNSHITILEFHRGKEFHPSGAPTEMSQFACVSPSSFMHVQLGASYLAMIVGANMNVNPVEDSWRQWTNYTNVL